MLNTMFQSYHTCAPDPNSFKIGGITGFWLLPGLTWSRGGGEA
jgi:hypothetical protein